MIISTELQATNPHNPIHPLHVEDCEEVSIMRFNFHEETARKLKMNRSTNKLHRVVVFFGV